MRILLILWLVPMTLMGTWYGLSANDINFGTVILSRELHDLVFQLYGQILGIDPARLPGMLAKTVAFDCCFVGCIIAYRKRKSWYPGFRRWWLNLESEQALRGTPAG